MNDLVLPLTVLSSILTIGMALSKDKDDDASVYYPKKVIQSISAKRKSLAFTTILETVYGLIAFTLGKSCCIG